MTNDKAGGVRVEREVRPLRCKFGFHRWDYLPWKKTHYDDVDRKRKCNLCGKDQVGEEHCLGMNPPDFVTDWMDA